MIALTFGLSGEECDCLQDPSFPFTRGYNERFKELEIPQLVKKAKLVISFHLEALRPKDDFLGWTSVS